MPKENYSLWSLIKKIWDLLTFISGFFRNNKEKEQILQKERLKEVVDELKDKYNEIDEKTENNKENINKRLNNMF